MRSLVVYGRPSVAIFDFCVNMFKFGKINAIICEMYSIFMLYVMCCLKPRRFFVIFVHCEYDIYAILYA